MENKKEKALLESVEGQAVNEAVEAAKAEGKVVKSDLDDMFAFETADVDAEEAESEVAVGSWKFPGVRVQREPFNYNGQTLYSYVAKLRVKVNVGGEDHIHELRADFRVADKKNRNAYDLLALLYKSLPEGQKYLLLGFRENYRKEYDFCVQHEIGEIPMIVSIVPKDTLSQNSLTSMAAYLKKKGML